MIVSFEELVTQIRYPAGESHVRLAEGIALHGIETVEATVRSFEDLAQVVVVDRIIRRLGHGVEWFLPYFPFARHDRRNDCVDGFELGLALEMVAELNPVIVDPHSDVAGQLRHFTQASVVRCFEDAGLFDDDPIVVIPDAGAAKKTYDWLNGRSVLQALKHRDPATGKLSGFAVPEGDLGGRPCIIVDDICDGGGTFLGLAAELRANNAGPLTLAVTHGIFSKGIDTLAESFATIACMAPAGVTIAGVHTIPFTDLYPKGTIT